MEYKELSGYLNLTKPQFTIDADLVFVPVGSKVHAVSVATGKLVYSLERHTKDITGIQLNPLNPSQLLSCSLDGTLCVWHYTQERPLVVQTVHRSSVEGLFLAPSLLSSPTVLARMRTTPSAVLGFWLRHSMVQAPSCRMHSL